MAGEYTIKIFLKMFKNYHWKHVIFTLERDIASTSLKFKVHLFIILQHRVKINLQENVKCK